jgi:hypothetical protein
MAAENKFIFGGFFVASENYFIFGSSSKNHRK